MARAWRVTPSVTRDARTSPPHHLRAAVEDPELTEALIEIGQGYGWVDSSGRVLDPDASS